MVVCMWISAVGFLLSLILHIAVWLDIEAHWYTVTQVLILGIFLLFLPLNRIASRLRRVHGKKGFVAALKRVFPGWIAAIMGWLIIYAIVVTVIQVVRKGKPAIMWSAIMMAGYALATSCYYSYNRLISSDNESPPISDDRSQSPET